MFGVLTKLFMLCFKHDLTVDCHFVTKFPVIICVVMACNLEAESKRFFFRQLSSRTIKMRFKPV